MAREDSSVCTSQAGAWELVRVLETCCTLCEHRYEGRSCLLETPGSRLNTAAAPPPPRQLAAAGPPSERKRSLSSPGRFNRQPTIAHHAAPIAKQVRATGTSKSTGANVRCTYISCVSFNLRGSHITVVTAVTPLPANLKKI